MQVADAVRDFAKVMEHVRAGTEVHLLKNGEPVAVVCQRLQPDFKVRPLHEVLAQLREFEASQDKMIPDPELEKHMGEAHERLNQPMDMSRWD